MTDNLSSGIDAEADNHLPPILSDSSQSEENPDPDFVKMFVAHVPPDWDEKVLTKYFKEFGPVYKIYILRYMDTNRSRKCCIVTFFSRQAALAAQNALDGIRTLPGMREPIYMRPHESRRSKQTGRRKIFVRGLPQDYDRLNLHELFYTFGRIRSCHIIRDVNGLSKGYGFITFDTSEEAMNAINAMNQPQAAEGGQFPSLVVEFAKTWREKYGKREGNIIVDDFTTASASASNCIPSTSNAAYHGDRIPTPPPYPLNFEQQYGTGEPYSMGLNDEPCILVPNASVSFQNVSNQASSYNEHGLNFQNFAIPASAASFTSAGQLMTTYNSITFGLNLPPVANVPFFSPMFIDPFCSSCNLNLSSFNQYPNIENSGNFRSTPQQAPLSTGTRVENSEGANLLIHGLPLDYTDDDLVQAFQPFGNIINSKVVIDKNTHLSRGFAFVNYDDPSAASSAIEAMNGMRIGTKCLVVRLK